MSTERAEGSLWGRRTGAFLLGAAAFSILALLSLMFAREAGRVAAIWPANGALLALVLLRPKTERAALIAGAFVGNVAVTLGMGDAVPIALGLSLANAVEVALAAWLLKDVSIREGLLRGPTLVRFATVAGLIAPVASTVIATGTLWLWHHEALRPNVLRWLVTDALGMLIVAPPLLLMSSPGAWNSKATLGGRLLMGGLLMGTLAAVFGQSSLPLLFLVPPVLILIVFRCGAGSASVGLLIASAVSLATLATGHGPIALIDGGLDQRAMVQQLFLATMVLTTLPVAAVLKDRAESEARYRLLAETATDVVVRFDAKGRFLYVSPSARAILGRDPEDMLGKDCTGIIPEDDLRVVRQTLIDYVMAGPEAPPPRYEYRALKANGDLIWLEATPRAIWDDKGRLVEFHDCVRDVTDRKAAEQAEQELSRMLRLAGEMAGLGHWRFDLTTQKVYWSEEVYRIHGRDPATHDPSYDSVLADYHPDDREILAACVERAISHGDGYNLDLRINHPKLGERHVVTRARTEKDADGRPVALFGVFQDVTEQVRAEEVIRASEARYRLLADNSTDIIATFGLDGVFHYVSPAVQAAMGYEAEAVIGRPISDFIHPEDYPRVLETFAAYAQAPEGTPSPRVAYRAIHRDGRTVWLEAHPKLIRDDHGRPVEFQDVVRDITATKALEEELIAAKEAAEHAVKAKGEFLANMSHELRTPLTSVIGFSGLLQDSPALPEAERRYADRIATASEALLGVINDILDYSKLEAEAVDLDPQPFDPAETARGAAAIVESQCAAKGLTLTLALDAGLPAALMGDEGRIRQVLLNFLSNAAKFTVSGEIRLESRWKDGRLRVAVSDSGIGVSPEKIDALFDRFTQADASTTRVYGGTGLGLAISRRLIEMMGGEIGATSRPGEGSTFWFEVPLPVAEAAEAVEAHEAVGLPPGLTVLMADDAPANRELVRIILAAWGVALETAENGAEAVAAAAKGEYDLILMDVHMPVMDGMDATRAIRTLPGKAGRTPILALTANVQPEQVEACRAAGMDAHIGKPIQVTDLIRTMDEVLAERRPQAEGEKIA
ncbi:PAS domain S-box protein [Brevundimonas sp. AAP58]|uniref:PAS domain S-box protein n=1 Tax=Brevundimonas sp. AAP58 TaxID=1523422 RepID=UPI0006B8B6CE|nr:PAS domain S-box protein [Brevundimonas sp. AAP58]